MDLNHPVDIRNLLHGFRKVCIEPTYGPLDHINAATAHHVEIRLRQRQVASLPRRSRVAVQYQRPPGQLDGLLRSHRNVAGWLLTQKRRMQHRGDSSSGHDARKFAAVQKLWTELKQRVPRPPYLMVW